MTLQTTLVHKTWGWRRLLVLLTLVMMVSGGLWWAKATNLLDNVVTSNTAANSTVNPSAAQPSAAQAPLNTNTASNTSAGLTNRATTSQTPTSSTTGEGQGATSRTAAVGTARDTEEAATVVRSLVAVAGIDGVQLWNAEGQLLTTLATGARVQATARTADGLWLSVTADKVTGWAQATQVVAFDLADLPVTTLPDAVATANTQPAVDTVSAASPNAASASTVTAISPPVTPTQPDAPVDNTVSAAVTAVVATRGANLNVRSGPGTTYALVTKVANGAPVTVVGRDASGAWLQIQLATGAADIGWAATAYLQMDSDIDVLPVITAVTD